MIKSQVSYFELNIIVSKHLYLTLIVCLEVFTKSKADKLKFGSIDISAQVAFPPKMKSPSTNRESKTTHFHTRSINSEARGGAKSTMYTASASRQVAKYEKNNSINERPKSKTQKRLNSRLSGRVKISHRMDKIYNNEINIF